MEARRKKLILNKLLPGILFLGTLTILIFWAAWRQHLLHTYYKYTIGITNKTYWTPGSGKQVEYRYSVNEIDYNEDDRILDKCIVPNGRYFVEYYPKDPAISKLIQTMTVPNSIKVAPSNGWDSLPIKAYKKE